MFCCFCNHLSVLFRYMVTKKEYESGSETEDEQESVKEKTPKKVVKVMLEFKL